MNSQSARAILPLYRTGKPMSDRVMKAVRHAEGSEELRPELQRQMDLDDEFVQAIQSVAPPESFRERIVNAAPAQRTRAQHARNPAILCAFFGVLVFAGILVFLKMQSSEDFAGRDRVESLLEVTARMTGNETESTQLPAGELVDNMMLQGFDGFVLPPPIAAMKAIEWRVFRHGQSGHRVAQVFIEEHGLVVFVFRTADFGIDPAPEGEWRVFTHKGWASAVTRRGNFCTLLAFRGGANDMKSFLATTKP